MQSALKRVCVFTGSRAGTQQEYALGARKLARQLVQRGYGLVYGGGKVGLMTIIADHVLELGGHVTGVIPSALVSREVAHLGLSDLRVVSSMHERKALMGELSDGFIAMPGGIGTLEEFFEVLSWAQLGIHNKPCGLLNVSGYFDYLIQFMDHALSRDFLKAKDRALLIVEADPARLLDRFERISADHATQRFDPRRT